MGALLTTSNVLILALVLAGIGFILGRSRALASVGGDQRSLHSRPKQHGWHVALAAFVPPFVLLVIWAFGSGLAANIYADAIVPSDAPEVLLPAADREGLSEQEVEIREGVRLGLVITHVKSLAAAIDGFVAGGATEDDVAALGADVTELQAQLEADGQFLATDLTDSLLDYAQDLRSFRTTLAWVGPALALILSVAGFVAALFLIGRDFRARMAVEGWTQGFLVFASTMAILTTIAILGALLLPSLTFFREYGFFQFLFGLEWAPAGDVVGVPEGHDGEYESALGFLPLIWGTLYISLVALLVAVPLGLFAAIYLSEFASARFRSLAKPALEILAGVPTIVYGIFALVTIGPFLQAVVGSTVMPNTVSIMTAGVVMGMMLVPFVSSLSDDVINAVPQAMRDGSLGLGATPSETVTKVILPAALPGIVGAVVLAASRAIGETMIVVLAAGALSNVTGLEANPFGAVVTVTTRIVAVLLGEGSGFDSIDVLAVFSLAFTLFFITLGLNLLAQRIVAKYREQYD